jgi:hypothetical protein
MFDWRILSFTMISMRSNPLADGAGTRCATPAGSIGYSLGWHSGGLADSTPG